MEPVVTFMTYPFGIVDVEDMSTKINTLFSFDSTVVENEVLILQSDIQLKAHSSDIHFWNLLSDEKYPTVKKVAFYLTSFSSSSYLRGSAFSTMNIKSKYRSCLTYDHLDSCFRLAATNYTPKFSKLVNSMKCKSSSSI
jgi:hypothetical protein